MTKAPSQAAANYQEPDFEYYKTKEPTATQQHFADWVIEKTGMTFETKKSEAAFRAGITIGTSLRGVHQASPENQSRLQELREARAAADAEAAANPKPKAEKAAPAAPAKAAPAKAAKATKATAPAAPPVEETAPAEVAPVRAPAKRGGRRAAATGSAPANVAAPF